MKAFEQICLPDEVSQLGDIAKLHHDLSLLSYGENVPKHIQQTIELSKNLLLYSHFVFDFTTAAVHYAQIALEAALRHALGKSDGDRSNIEKMVAEAEIKNLLSGVSPEYIMLAKITHKSRNGIAHGKESRDVFNHALAIPYVQAILDIINALFASSKTGAHIDTGQSADSDD